MSPLRKVFCATAFLTAFCATAACVAPEESEAETSGDAVTGRRAAVSTNRVELSDTQARQVAEKKATCPFVGAVTALKKLDVLNTIEQPLARIRDVVRMGDEGGGNLGSTVLNLFATGNHARIGTEQVPDGTFSLDFPKSQGAHPGHSGILMTGLKGHYVGGMAAPGQRELGKLLSITANGEGDLDPNGKYILRRDLGRYVWREVSADPEAVYVGSGNGIRNAIELARDTGAFMDTLEDAAQEVAFGREPNMRPIVEQFVKISVSNNLIGSAGEWSLLLTSLEQAKKVPMSDPDAVEPAMAAADVRAMFVDKKLPSDWATKKKTAGRWVVNMLMIVRSAEAERLGVPRQHPRDVR
jgi:hypothetical protein